MEILDVEGPRCEVRLDLHEHITECRTIIRLTLFFHCFTAFGFFELVLPASFLSFLCEQFRDSVFESRAELIRDGS